MLTKQKFFFQRPDAKKNYGHKNIENPRLCKHIGKWTFINV